MSLDLDLVRERFESSTDFTIGLEEEFAILDPATLELEHRFEEVKEICDRNGATMTFSSTPVPAWDRARILATGNPHPGACPPG